MRTESQIDIHFRNLLPGDLDRVMQIERSCFFTPWNRATMLHKLAGRRIIAQVATLGRDDPIAYVICDVLPTEVEIENMAVDPHYQRLGIGRRMIDRLSAKKRPKIVAAVWERNVEAQLFFRAMEASLERVGIRISGESVRGSICALDREGEIQWLFRRPNPSGYKARVWWIRARLCEYLSQR